MSKLLLNIGITPKATLSFFILHILFAPFIMNSREVATYYAIFIFLISIWIVLTNKEIFVNCIISYLVGSEVLYRMSEAKIFWEFGKYSISVILIIFLLLARKGRKNSSVNLILYFVLLLPAILWTPYFSFDQWRQDISFNMSGPLSLLICGLYFSRLELKQKDLQRMFIWLLAPIVSISFIALKGIKETPDITWGTASSHLASGGFGPNQVSSILGFGALLCVILFFFLRRNKAFKIIFLPLGIWFFIQAILTFSRGGVFNAVFPTFIFLLLLMRKRNTIFSALFFGIFIILLLDNYLIPKLNDLTGGALTLRYTRKEKIQDIEIIDTTKRFDIFMDDINIFKSNLLFGVGVGNSSRLRREDIIGVAAHIELSRVLAEHGILGLFAIIFLLLWILKRIRSNKDLLTKALVCGLATFGILYTFHAATRLALFGFVIGLLGADFKIEKLTPQLSKIEMDKKYEQGRGSIT